MIPNTLEDALRAASQDVVYCTIPETTIKTLWDYVHNRLVPGGFVTAVLANNLLEAVGRADSFNIRALKAICTYVYMELPSSCYGSDVIVTYWLLKEPKI